MPELKAVHVDRSGTPTHREDGGRARLLERLGFRLEGHLHENYLADDVFIDSLIYSLLRRKWKGKGGGEVRASLTGGEFAGSGGGFRPGCVEDRFSIGLPD